ncbi:hypothetical protein Tco_1577134 [Tanacetum coccineum]
MCSTAFSLFDGSTDPGMVDPCTFMVDSSGANSADDPTKFMGVWFRLLVNMKKISPLRPEEGVGTDGVEECLIEVLASKELPINDVSRMDGAPCKSVVV